MSNYIKERKALIKELSESLLSEAGGGGCESYAENISQDACLSDSDCSGGGPCGGHCWRPDPTFPGWCVYYYPV